MSYPRPNMDAGFESALEACAPLPRDNSRNPERVLGILLWIALGIVVFGIGRI